MTDRAELRVLAMNALTQETPRSAMTFTEAGIGNYDIPFPAKVWFDDGDCAAFVFGNLGLDILDDALAEFWAAANPDEILKLLDRLDALEAALRKVPEWGDPPLMRCEIGRAHV